MLSYHFPSTPSTTMEQSPPCHARYTTRLLSGVKTGVPLPITSYGFPAAPSATTSWRPPLQAM